MIPKQVCPVCTTPTIIDMGELVAFLKGAADPELCWSLQEIVQGRLAMLNKPMRRPVPVPPGEPFDPRVLKQQ
jgi:hypothetical protein